ncbi:MAG: hypothetical protein HYZ29_33710 [Myxococcales bacterium]|nr:hypothetical protein [Myxococcales bacterium]
MTPADRQSLAISLIALVVVVTCAGGSVGPAHPGAPPPPSATPPPAPSPEASVPAASALPSASPPAAVPAPPSGLALPKLRAALAALAANERTTPVRVVWLGDSHTAADFWPHALRRPLQERFGNGGPGFVQLGVEPYRHALLKVGREGTWRREPSSPAGSMKQLDGVFGLSGQRAVPESADARASVELTSKASAGKTRYSLWYRAKPADRVRLSIRGSAESESATAKSGRALGSLRVHTIESAAPATLDVGVSGGAPEIFGVTVESVTPGLVLDTLGINGARAATPLAWNEVEWRAALGAREPSLVVFAYGTNEAASTLASTRYEKTLDQLVERVRGAAPAADCLIVGPPDMISGDGKTAPRVIEFDQTAERTAARLGCGYFSAWSAMGGEGSMARWMKEKPPLAAPDGIHLAPGGYERLGQALSERVLGAVTPAK